MDIHNKQLERPSLNILKLLDIERLKRNFNVKNYIENKIKILNDYCLSYSLSSCVVGVSGGVDSAIVLYLINEARKQENSVIKNILCVYMPVNNGGMSNKESSYLRAKELCDNIGLELLVLDLTEINKSYDNLITNSLNLESNEWSKGQLVAYSRTPTLYYVSTLLNQHNKKAIIVGTTNKDEGSYIGYIGKASDAMVDIQLISDITKNEVFKIAKELDIPKSIIDVVPSGDMYDSRKDEEVFGTTYDFIELYSYYLNNKKIIDNLNEKDRKEFDLHAINIEELHKYNKHKYLACSQAVHLDVLPSKVNGGWSYNTYKKIENNFINQKLIYNDFIENFDSDYKIESSEKVFDGEVLNDVLLDNENDYIVNFVNSQSWVNVGYDGILNNFRINDKTGSKRLSIYSEEFAKLLWNRIKDFYNIKETNQYSFVENDNHKLWKPIGINPLFRFIKYNKNNLLVNHYDSPYIENSNIRSMMTLVIYLTTNKEGSTRFFYDEQDGKPLIERNLNDWKTIGNEDEIKVKILPKKCQALTFDHRLLHDSEPIINEEKIIIRTDIMFEKVI